MYVLTKNMKIVKKKSTENCHFYSREKSLFIARACFHNELYSQKDIYLGYASVKSQLSSSFPSETSCKADKSNLISIPVYYCSPCLHKPLLRQGTKRHCDMSDSDFKTRILQSVYKKNPQALHNI